MHLASEEPQLSQGMCNSVILFVSKVWTTNIYSLFYRTRSMDTGELVIPVFVNANVHPYIIISHCIREFAGSVVIREGDRNLTANELYSILLINVKEFELIGT